MWEKFKHVITGDRFYFVFVVMLVGFGSFALGRYSVFPVMPGGGGGLAAVSMTYTEVPKAKEPDLAPVKNKPIKKTTIEEKLPESASSPLVASKSGTKYHLTTCPGAGRIKEENKIYFSTTNEAEAAGYTPAANCKGLQ